MKKLLLPLAVLTVLAIGCGSKDVPTPTPPTPVYHTVTAAIDTGSGSISPLSTTVLDGNSVVLYISPNAGWRVSVAKANGTAVNVTANAVVLNKVTSDTKVDVWLTDSLSSQQMDSLKSLFCRKWVLVAEAGTVSKQSVIGWMPYYLPPCNKYEYTQFIADYTYVFVQEPGACDGDTPGSGTWSIWPNGKQLTMVNGDSTHAVFNYDFNVTADTLNIILRNQVTTSGTKWDYLFTCVPKK
jgi:hypothetical protein